MLLSKLLPNLTREPLQFVDISIRITDIQGNYTGFNHSQGYRDYRGLGWLVLVRQPITIAFAPFWTLQYQIRLWSLVGGMLFAGIGWLIAGWIVNPILAIATAADQIRRGNTQREQQYRTLVQNFPVGGVFLFDSDLRYTLADGKGLAEIGLSKELMEGKTIWEVLLSETTEMIEPIYRSAVEGSTSTFEIPYAGRTYLLYALPVKNEQEEILSGMVIAQDITDRKRAELALLQLKDELEIKVQKRTADLTFANQKLQEEIIQRQQAQQELQESELLMRSLHQVTTNPQLTLKERFQQLLAIGCRHFNLDFGFIASIDGKDYKVISTQTPDNSVAVGDTFDLRKSYCLVTIEQEEPLCISHATTSEWVNHPGYKGFLMETYIGMKIMMNNAIYGTICFTSHSPTSRQFCSVDFELIKLIAQWIGSEIERSKAAARLEQLRHQNELIMNYSPLLR